MAANITFDGQNPHGQSVRDLVKHATDRVIALDAHVEELSQKHRLQHITQEEWETITKRNKRMQEPYGKLLRMTIVRTNGLAGVADLFFENTQEAAMWLVNSNGAKIKEIYAPKEGIYVNKEPFDRHFLCRMLLRDLSLGQQSAIFYRQASGGNKKPSRQQVEEFNQLNTPFVLVGYVQGERMNEPMRIPCKSESEVNEAKKPPFVALATYCRDVRDFV